MRDCATCGDAFKPQPFQRTMCWYCSRVGAERAISPSQQDDAHGLIAILRELRKACAGQSMLGVIIDAVDSIYMHEKNIQPNVYEMMDVPDRELADILTEYVARKRA